MQSLRQKAEHPQKVREISLGSRLHAAGQGGEIGSQARQSTQLPKRSHHHFTSQFTLK